MTRELLGFGLVGVLITAAVAWTWFACKARRRRWVYPVLALLLGAPLILLIVNESMGEGDVLCFDCGRSRHELTVFGLGIPVAREPDAIGVGAISDEYATAFANSVGAAHSQRWSRVGCYRSGIGLSRSVSCTEIGPCHWYRDLPKQSDRVLVSALADRFARASPSERNEVLRSYDHFADVDVHVDDRVPSWRAGWAQHHSPWP